MIKRQIPAPPDAVVEEIKKYFQDTSVLDKWNEGRHPDDQIHDYIEWIGHTKFGVSTRTIYNRLKSINMSIATIKSNSKDLDVPKIIKTMNLDKFEPVVYELKADLNKTKKTKILMISDIQAGNTITSNGKINPFEYVKYYFNKLKEQLKQDFEMELPEKLIITLIGDLVDGENIFLHQQVIPVEQQVKLVADLLYDLIQFINAFNIKIQIYSVRGNHGNISKYHVPTSNWDNVIFDMLKMRYDVHHKFEDATNVELITTENSDYVLFKLNNWQFMIHHGDFVRGLFNKAGELNTQPIQSKMKQMKLSEYPELNALLIGHWHKFHFGEIFKMQYVINGTMYESPFVRKTLNGRETLAFCLLTVGNDIPISNVKLLYLGDYNGQM